MLGTPFEDALVADALQGAESAAWLELALLTFARFAEAQHFVEIRRLIAAAPHASRKLRVYWKLTEAIMASRLRSSEAPALLRTAADDAERAGMPLFAALALELGGKVDAAMRLYERHAAQGHVSRLRANASQTLTPRETEVAALVAEGRSNRAIAEVLVLSERTVENHVASILRKLGLTGRADLGARLYGQSHRDTS